MVKILLLSHIFKYGLHDSHRRKWRYTYSHRFYFGTDASLERYGFEVRCSEFAWKCALDRVCRDARQLSIFGIEWRVGRGVTARCDC